MLSSMMERVLVWFVTLFVGKVMRNLIVKIPFHLQFLFGKSSAIFSLSIILRLFWPVLIGAHNQIMVNTLKLLILLFCSDLDLTSGRKLLLSQSLLDLIAFKLYLRLLIILIELLLLHLLKLHKCISIWL